MRQLAFRCPKPAARYGAMIPEPKITPPRRERAVGITQKPPTPKWTLLPDSWATARAVMSEAVRSVRMPIVLTDESGASVEATRYGRRRPHPFGHTNLIRDLCSRTLIHRSAG